MKLICLGDSVTFGYGVPMAERWTTLTAQASGWQLVNAGVCGDTTGGMLVRMRMQLLADGQLSSIHSQRPRILLMGGSNDIFYAGSDIPARANFGAMLQELVAMGLCPMVGIPLPLDADSAPAIWGQVVDFAGAVKLLEEYCLWLKRFAEALGLPVVDFRADFLHSDGSVRRELFLPDGMHPSVEGHRRMAQRLTEQLLAW